MVYIYVNSSTCALYIYNMYICSRGCFVLNMNQIAMLPGWHLLSHFQGIRSMPTLTPLDVRSDSGWTQLLHGDIQTKITNIRFSTLTTKQTCLSMVLVRSSTTWSSMQGPPIFPNAWQVLIIIPEALMSSTMSNHLQERVILWTCVTHLALGSLSNLYIVFWTTPRWMLMGWCMKRFPQLFFRGWCHQSKLVQLPFAWSTQFFSDHCRIR